MSQAIDNSIRLTPPSAGQTVNVPIDRENMRMTLGFEPDPGAVEKNGQNLEFSFEDGGKLVLEGYYDHFASKTLPVMVTESGDELPGEDFLASLREDLLTAAGPGAGGAGGGSGSGEYADDPGSLIDGISRFGSLGTIYWDRATEVPEEYHGVTVEQPGGSFALGVNPEGLSFGTSYIYEDWQPNQHLDGDAASLVSSKINFEFTPTGSTVVDGVTINGFTPGTVLYLGDPASPGTSTITVGSLGENVSFTHQQLIDGVYIKPPVNDDTDMTLNASVDLRAESSGQTTTVTGTITVIVDAVADLPVNQESELGAAVLDGAVAIGENANTEQTVGDGWYTDKFGKDGDVDAAAVKVSVDFTATIAFRDYLDGSESHYALVEVPGTANGTPAPGADGAWSLVITDPNLTYHGTTTVYFDAAGNPLGEGVLQADGTIALLNGGVVTAAQLADGSVTAKDYFKIEVSNEAIADGTPGEYEVNVTFESSDSNLSTDTTFNLNTGSMATENIAAGDRELTTENNNAYAVGDELGQNHELVVDTVDSVLTVKVGWASEDGDNSQHVAGQYTADSTTMYDTDGNRGIDAGSTNDGDSAPISFSISGVDASGNNTEAMTSVRLYFDTDAGGICVNGAPLTPVADANGKWYVELTQANGGIDASGLNTGNVTFAPKEGSNLGTDVSLTYEVTVVAQPSGAEAVYKGETSVAIDAVADMPTGLAIDHTYEDGYVAAKPGGVVAIDGSANFNDNDGSERHYLVVALPDSAQDAGWNFKGLGNADLLGQDPIEAMWVANNNLPGNEYVDSLLNGTSQQLLVLEVFMDDAGNWNFAVHTGQADSPVIFGINETIPTGLEFLENISFDPVSGEFNYTLNLEAPTVGESAVDTSADVYTKAVSIENAEGVEYDYANNAASSQGSAGVGSPNGGDDNGWDKTPVESSIVDSTLKIEVNPVYEGGDANKHEGAVVASSPDAGKITLSLTNGQEMVTELYLRYADKAGDAADGSITLGGVTVDSGTLITLISDDGSGNPVTDGSGNILYTGASFGDESVTFTAPGVLLGDLPLTYAPNPVDAATGEGYSDIDIVIEYAAVIEDPKSGDSIVATNMPEADLAAALGTDILGNVREVEGPADGQQGAISVGVDAVADRPDVYLAKDGSEVDYGTNPLTGEERTGAAPGENVTLHAKVEFYDPTGEEHFVLIQVPPVYTTYVGYSIDGLTYTFPPQTSANTVTIDGVKYYKLPVGDNTALGTIDVTLTVQSSATVDMKHSINIGSYADEGVTPDWEGTTVNNTAWSVGTVSFEAAPAEAATVTPAITYEDRNSTQHIGVNTTSQTWGNIVFKTSDAEKDETITSIKLTYAGKLEDIGRLEYPVGVLAEATYDPVTNTTTITITDNPAIVGDGMNNSVTVKFIPSENSDVDFNFKYEVTTQDPESGDTKVTSGSNVVRVDAVADKPIMDAETTIETSYNAADGADQAAQPGETVKLSDIDIIFNDYKDGSETHYLMVEKKDVDSTTAGNQFNTFPDQTVTLAGKGYTLEMVIQDGKIIAISLDGEAQGANSPYGSYLGTPINVHTVGSSTSNNTSLTDNDSYNNNISGNNGTYFKIPVPNEFLQLTDGEISATVTVGLPDTYSADTGFDIKVGGMALESNPSESETGTTSGATRDNNAAYDFQNAHVDVGVVTSAPSVSLPQVYENGTQKANVGDDTVTYGNIVLHDIAKGETAVFTFTFGATNQDGSPVLLDADPDGKGTLGINVGGTWYSLGETAAWPDGFSWQDNGDGTYSITVTLTGTGNDISLEFFPGHNYNSKDIQVEYEATITDDASGHTKDFSSTGKTGTEPLPGDSVIEVDAVAQKPTIDTDNTIISGKDTEGYSYAEDAHRGDSSYGHDKYDKVIPGGTAKVTVAVNLQGDVSDDSEVHSLYIEQKLGWNLELNPDGTVTLVINGVEYDCKVVQQFTNLGGEASGGTADMYWKVELPNEAFNTDGTGDVTFSVKTPSGVGSSAELKVGLGTWEDAGQLDGERPFVGDDNNNTAYDGAKVTINFSSAGSVGVNVLGNYFENNQGNANLEDYNYTGVGVRLQPVLGDANDHVDKFVLSIDPYTSGTDTGTVDDPGDLYLFASPQDYANFQNAVANGGDPYDQALLAQHNGVNCGNTISYDPANNTYSPADIGSLFDNNGGFKGQIVFMPGTDTNSGEDPSFIFDIKVTDIQSGHVSEVAGGSASVTADSVAQVPHGLDAEVKDGASTDVVIGSDGYTVTVSAGFEDYLDGSTDHYILIEANAGWTLTYADASGGIHTLGASDLITFGEGGTVYYKIDVTDSIDPVTGKASVEVTCKPPTNVLFSNADGGEYSFDVGAASRDMNGIDNELTYHNNTAEISAEGWGGTLNHSHTGVWTLEQTGAVYEDNQANKHTGDYKETAGHFEIGHPDADAAFVKVDCYDDGTPKLVLLDKDGDPYEFDSSTGEYKVTDLDFGFDVKLSEGYLAKEGANNDADLSIESIRFVNGDTDILIVAPGAGGEYDDHFTVVVDAVADRVETVTATTTPDGVDIANDGVVSSSEAGKDSVAKFTVTAEFPDADGSENHYLLVEMTPGWTPVGSYDTVSVGDETYYRIDVTAQANAGDTEFDVSMKFNGHSASTADQEYTGKAGPDGVTEYTLKVGAMSQEMGATDVEFDLQNNIAVNVDGTVTLKHSEVDTTISITVNNGDHTAFESADGTTSLPITLNIPDMDAVHDELVNFSFTYDDSMGTLSIDGVKIGSGETLTQAQIDAAQAGNMSYTPNAFEHGDPSISWNYTIKDTVSGQVVTKGGSVTITVDAVANGQGDDFAVGSESATGAEAIVSGDTALVTVKTDFIDSENSSEEHWVVLSQDTRHSLVDVTVTDSSGNVLNNVEVVTKFDSNGHPYYAVKVPQGDQYTVEFEVKVPAVDTDTSFNNLSAGSIVLDTSTTGETTLSNNWKEDIKPVEIKSAVLTADGVTGADVTTNEDTSVVLQIGITNGTNESITELTIDLPMAEQGVLYYNGTEVTGTLDFQPGAFDSSLLVFEPAENWSGTYEPNFTATVTDNASGEFKEGFEGSLTVSVAGVADAPDVINPPVYGEWEKVDGQHAATVAVALSGTFPDTTGELHYFLLATPLPEGLTLVGTYEQWTLDGTTYYRIPADDSAVSGATATITLRATADYDGTQQISISGVSQEYAVDGVAPSTEISDVVSASGGGSPLDKPGVDVLNDAPTVLGNAAGTIGQLGGGFEFTDKVEVTDLFADTDDGAESLSIAMVKFGENGAAMSIDDAATDGIKGDYGTLFINADGTYTYQVTEGAVIPAGTQETFYLVGTDGATVTESAAKLDISFDHEVFSDILGSSDYNIVAGSADDSDAAIYGSTDSDVIYASSAGSTIYGGAGDDIMIGGDGTDVFAWTASDLGGMDTILDFEMNKDALLFETLFADKPEGMSQTEALTSMIGNGLDVTTSGDGMSVTLTMGGQQVDIALAGDGLNNLDGGNQFVDLGETSDAATKVALIEMMITQVTG